MAEKVKINLEVVGKGIDKVGNQIGELAKAATVAALALGAAFAIRGAFKAAKEVEKLETQLGILLKSTTAATAQLKELQKFAATTPFELIGLAETTAQLLSFGFAQDTIIDKLKVLGDIAAGSGTDLKEIALIFGQVSAAGKLTGERLLQLQERAIPIGAALASTLGVAESAVKDLVSSGKVGFKEFEKAFRSMTEEGGLFEGATVKLSKTLGGVLSTLSDNFFNLQAAIGKTFSPLVVLGANRLIAALQKLTDVVIDNSIAITQSLITAIKITSFLTERLVKLVQNQILVFNGLRVVIAAIVAVFGRFAQSVGIVLEFLGADGALSQGLINFGETSKAVLRDAITPLSESIRGLFNPSEFSEQSDAFLSELQSFVDEQASIAEGGIDAQKRIQQEAVKTAEVTSKALAAIINSAVVQTTSRGIQAMTQSLIAGGNAFADFTKTIFSIMGDLSIKLGETLLLIGIGLESVFALQGGQAIIAGIGLIALGAVLKSFGGGGAPSLGGAAGAGPGTTPVDTGTPGALFGGEETEPTEPTTQVSVIIQGDVFDTQETGLKIVEILNNAFEKDGVVIKRGAIG